MENQYIHSKIPKRKVGEIEVVKSILSPTVTLVFDIPCENWSQFQESQVYLNLIEYLDHLKNIYNLRP